MILGIDASSLRQGGTVTHLAELLRAADAPALGCTKIVVWAGRETLDRLEERPWLVKRWEPALDAGLPRRVRWQWRELPRRLRTEGCDVLFVPGGYHFDRFRPAVAMSQNLLPFEPSEIRRYGVSRGALRLLLLRWGMGWSFRRSAALITLTDYARRRTLAVARPRSGKVATIPHGIAPAFFHAPRPSRRIEECDRERPFRILYVSTLDRYKHQWHVADAVAQLGRAGLPVRLDLIGGAVPPSDARLARTLRAVDPEGRWVRYHGEIPHAEIPGWYRDADLFVLASSCEAFGQILTEAMAARLPILCADRSSLPELLGEAGVYVDPEDPAALAAALQALITDPARREALADAAQRRARAFTWARCAHDTFQLFREVA